MAEVTPSTYPISVEETVEDIPSFVQSIAAEALMSAFAIVPSRIIVLVTVPEGNVTVPVNVGEANGALASI